MNTKPQASPDNCPYQKGHFHIGDPSGRISGAKRPDGYHVRGMVGAKLAKIGRDWGENELGLPAGTVVQRYTCISSAWRSISNTQHRSLRICVIRSLARVNAPQHIP
jgi:hypothetical protein